MSTSWIYYEYIMNTSRVHHTYIIRASWVHHEYIIRTSYVHHEYIMSTSWVHHEYIMSTSWVHHVQMFKNPTDKIMKRRNLQKRHKIVQTVNTSLRVAYDLPFCTCCHTVLVRWACTLVVHATRTQINLFIRGINKYNHGIDRDGMME